MVRLQIEVPAELKLNFKEQASQYGMDITNALRFVMQQFSSGAIVPVIQTGISRVVSPQKAAEYDEITKAIKSGDEQLAGPFDSAEELMSALDK